MNRLTASDYPAMENQDRKNYHNSVLKLAYPNYKEKVHSMKNAIEKLKQGN